MCWVCTAVPLLSLLTVAAMTNVQVGVCVCIADHQTCSGLQEQVGVL